MKLTFRMSDFATAVVPLLAAASVLVLALAAPAAQAALQLRPGGLVYDTASDLTWLVDWNAGAGSAFDDGSSAVDGRMSWASAMAWADALQAGGVDDWRLPAADGCLGFGCRGSEFGRLWYEALGLPGGVTPASMAPFERVQAAPYWTSTPLGAGTAGYFNAQGGSQNGLPMAAQSYAVAVRRGDVALVPEPATAWLLLAGLAIAAGAWRRQRPGTAA